MNGLSLMEGRAFKRAVKFAATSLAIAGLGALSGCLTRPIQPIDPKTTSTVVERLTQTTIDKIDLLLAIDNSRSMADKQQVLALAIPDLLSGLLLPKCVDPMGNPVATQPSDPITPCPAGSVRDFTPVLDIHVGIVTSSLGGFGSDACPDTETDTCKGSANTSQNDHGHLVTRQDPCKAGTNPTYQSKGFLAWDPGKKLTPNGETQIGDGMTSGIVFDLKNLVSGVGQIGCGYESQNEGWYRFLVDPTPPQSITLVNGLATPQGTDNALLQQRADFMRSDSLLAIIVLTDENDASIKEFGQYWYVAQAQLSGGTGTFHLPRPRAICATDPANPCCLSCGQKAPKTCPADPTCSMNGGFLDDKDDPYALREWHSKQRFGIEFYYTPDRYVNALKSTVITDRNNQMVANPIFSVLNPAAGTSIRDPSLVFLAEIVGVPWQDIARTDANGKPDLLTGLDIKGNKVGGFKSWDQMTTKDAKGHTTWDVVIGNADFVTTFGDPLDPLMIESALPRTAGAMNPITGDPIAPPTAPSGSNPINGHEWDTANGDLQYACIFDLLMPRNCADPKQAAACDCITEPNNNPLCDPNPADGMKRTLQSRAKAYPGLKELSILKQLGAQGIVGSICPKQLTDNTLSDFGYRPAIHAIIDRLKQALGGQCLPRMLTPDANGQVPCLILEARHTGGKCDCAGKARQAVSPEHMPAEMAAQSDPLAASAMWDCFCEITQADKKSGALDACQTDASTAPILPGSSPPQNVDGWCYVDAAQGDKEAKIVAKCPATEQRQVRFVGGGAPHSGATLFITCSGQ